MPQSVFSVLKRRDERDQRIANQRNAPYPVEIGEMTLIEHMIARAKKIKDATIIVSTDSNIIYDYAVKHCVEAILSKKVFKNGTERCYFTAKTYRAKPSDIIINLQADEFNINVTYINKLIKLLKSFKTESVATLMYKTNSSCLLYTSDAADE